MTVKRKGRDNPTVGKDPYISQQNEFYSLLKWCFSITGSVTFCFLIVLLILQSVAGSPFPIRHLGINQGLSNNSVRCIFQDKDGFMWFGTYDGLNRYDGYSFKTYRNILGDTASLSHNYINTIGEDFQHRLVVGTGQGVSIYNSLTQQFSTGQYIPSGEKQPRKILFNVNAIKADAKGNLYMTTGKGGLLVKPNGEDVARQIACLKDAKGACDSNANAHNLVIDRQQRIWILSGNSGLFRYLPDSRQLQLVTPLTLSVRRMEADDAGNLWMGTYDGQLYKYDIARNQLSRPYEQISNTRTRSILSLFFDAAQRQLWIGTEGGGIGILDVLTGKIAYLLPAEGRNMLSSETVYAIYEDREHRKWIGTHKGGIDIIDPQPNPFRTISYDPLNRNSLAGNFVASFYEDSSRNLWIGTDGGGISCWNRSDNQFTNYRHQEGNSSSLSHNSVPSITEDYLGNIWIATFGGGINRFNKASGHFQHYRCIIPESGTENNYVWNLLEDRRHMLWATTFANGHLYRLNRQADRFEMFSPEAANFLCLAENDTGSLWAGTASSLCKIEIASRKYIHLNISKPVRSLLKDRRGRLWLGTEGMGLMLLNKAGNRIEATYTTTNGLCNNSVLNILEDNAGHLWLSTFHGLSRFDPQTSTFTNYYGEDGLQSDQFEYNAALRLRSGEMVFGGIAGFSLFNPGQLPLRSFNPPVVLTGLRINNTNVAEGSVYVTAMQPDGIAAVRIPYHEASLSFDFAALEYAVPGKINYAYYLEGWDKGWNYTRSIRSANYTRLADGTYTLHIKATNEEGGWNAKEVTLKVVVLPPWYRSWWAYILYAAFLAGILYLYNAYRVRKAKLEYEVKLARVQHRQEKELVQLEIQQEKQLAQLEIQKEKELAEKKLTFFTDVSHEFRTPLTLIINPLKDYLENEQQDKKELTGVYRNARRLLTLVNQLLQFRKAGENADSLRIVKLNLNGLCREIFASFEGSARKKNLSYRFFSNSDAAVLYGDREKMEVILYNLLSNAIKFTPEGGEIEMQITEKKDTLVVKLTDNGQGIPADVGNKLFERFYRVTSEGEASKPGFGIGLYLVKHFVERHKAEITYESQPGSGTTFCLSFRKGTAHFGDIPIYEDRETEALEKPLVPEEAAKTTLLTPEKNSPDDLMSSQKAILIVEDNEQIREYLGSIFRDSFTVYQAGSGNEGIAMARNYLPDIIISDIMMEGGNGIELCSAIKNDPSLGHIPVILLTAVSDDAIRLKGTESGADDYLTKPFEKDLLVARVHSLLKNRTKLQQYFYNEVTLKKQDFKISAEYREFLDNCIAIIERHLDDDSFNIKKLSMEIGMSHSTLFRRVKSVSGLSIASFIRFIRLRKAAELMIQTNDNVSQIAFAVCMNDIKYFRKQFNALFGMNPSEYIKKYRPPFTNTTTLTIRPLRKNDKNG